MSNPNKYLDYEGVKYLWSKINMQDYLNSEALINIINGMPPYLVVYMWQRIQ